MKDNLRTALFALGSLLLLTLASCAPCRPVRIDSRPPGAEVFVERADPFTIRAIPSEGGRWKPIGITPLEVSECLLTPEVRARWQDRELFLFGYHGQERISFDFERETVSGD